jgi:hypothetical protein
MDVSWWRCRRGACQLYCKGFPNLPKVCLVPSISTKAISTEARKQISQDVESTNLLDALAYKPFPNSMEVLD